MTIVARLFNDEGASKSAYTRAREQARFHSRPTVHEFPGFDGESVTVKPEVWVRDQGDHLEVERKP